MRKFECSGFIATRTDATGNNQKQRLPAVVLMDDGGPGAELAKGYASGHAGEATFPEYCQRPETADEAKEVEITFSDKAGGEFYKQVQDAIDDGDVEPFFDFSQMPADWEVPAESTKKTAEDADAKLVAV